MVASTVPLALLWQHCTTHPRHNSPVSQAYIHASCIPPKKKWNKIKFYPLTHFISFCFCARALLNSPCSYFDFSHFLLISNCPFVLSIEDVVSPARSHSAPTTTAGKHLIHVFDPLVVCSWLLPGRQLLPKKANSSIGAFFPSHRVSHLECLPFWFLGCTTPTDFQVGLLGFVGHWS